MIQKILTLTLLGLLFTLPTKADVGVGAKPIEGAELIFDGSREMLDKYWTYWEGPRFSSSLPIKWKIVKDPAGEGTVMVTHDPAAKGGKYGAADIVTKKKYRDFRLHVEFLIPSRGGNSGVYLQNRYEIQILDGDKGKHGLGAIINETPAPYFAYNGLKRWNSYDVNFRAARFKDGKRVEKARVTVYFNGVLVHENKEINKVWGGPNSGIDGGNQGGTGITDRPGGLKLQAEGHDVHYRNIWIKEVTLDKPDTRFGTPKHSALKPVPRGGGWMRRHESFNKRVKQGNVDLLFIGDSITHGWERNGKKVWEQYYGKRNAVNLGIGGDRTQHVLWRLDNGNVEGISPKVAVVMIGTNNSGDGRSTAQEMLDGVTQVVGKLRSKLPKTHVVLLDIFPRGWTFNNQRGKILQVNQALRKLEQDNFVTYLPIGHKFLEMDGSLSKKIMPDALHLSPEGYLVWAKAIEPTLKRFFK